MPGECEGTCNRNSFLGSVGLVLERIIDVVDVSAELQTPGSRAGVKGTLLVRGRVAEYVDVEHLVRLADPHFFSGEEA